MLSGWFGSSTPDQEVIFPELPTPKTLEDYQQVSRDAKARVLKLADEQEGWEEVGFTEMGLPSDIKVFSKSEPNSSIECTKGIAILPGSPKDVLALVTTTDLQNRKQWDKDLVDIKLIERIDDKLAVYWAAYNAPFPVKNRDFVILISIEAQDDGSYIAFATSINYSAVKENPSYVRAVNVTSATVIRPVEGNPNQSKVIRMNQVDPKGMIPYMIVNAGKTRPALVIQEMRRILSKS